MKNYKIILLILLTVTLYSCENISSSNVSVVKNKKELLTLIKNIDKTILELKENKISKASYITKMEDFGDIIKKSIEIIPPEKRYMYSINCYSEALKYDRKNTELSNKLQEQKKLFQIVNIK